MASQLRVGRREFVMASAGAVAAGIVPACRAATVEDVQAAAAKVGRVPRRRLGQGNQEVSVLIGAASWSSEAVEAGIRCGVNFWHAAQDWGPGQVPQAILKNRDAHYCQVSIDRARGSHETGKIDEEAHYRAVKQALEKTGLRYFDDLQFHFGFHNAAEVRRERGFVRAFERLKKEGLVRHLCLSQHHYGSNWRVENGQNGAEILTAVIEDGIFEHGQFMYSYGEASTVNEMISLARRRGFGTIAMKTTRGAARMQRDHEFMKKFPAGTTPHQALVRWLTTGTELDAAVIQINNLDQFVEDFSAAGKPMRAVDAEALGQLREFADREVCRLCNECQAHCGQGLAVADILRYERYATDYGQGFRARLLYAWLDRQADSCIACGNCLPHCPQRLAIPENLAAAHKVLRG
ncbi:MAG: 4Fe-4S dicluster domain-containing protein [Deltaproteobacteria bacterium]